MSVRYTTLPVLRCQLSPVGALRIVCCTPLYDCGAGESKKCRGWWRSASNILTSSSKLVVDTLFGNESAQLVSQAHTHTHTPYILLKIGHHSVEWREIKHSLCMKQYKRLLIKSHTLNQFVNKKEKYCQYVTRIV